MTKILNNPKKILNLNNKHRLNLRSPLNPPVPNKPTNKPKTNKQTANKICDDCHYEIITKL